MRDFGWYLLRFLCSVAHLVDGIFGTLTLGFWSPDCSLSAQAHFLDHCDRLAAAVPLRALDVVICRGRPHIICCVDAVTQQVELADHGWHPIHEVTRPVPT